MNPGDKRETFEPVFPIQCVHGPHTPAPIVIRAAPQCLDALEAALRRRTPNEAVVREISAFQTAADLERHPNAEVILALYAALRPFIVL